MKLGELAKKLGAELCGDAELEVTGVKGIEEAGPTEITFVANPKYGGLRAPQKRPPCWWSRSFQRLKRPPCASRTLTTPFRGLWASSISRRLTRPASIQLQ